MQDVSNVAPHSAIYPEMFYSLHAEIVAPECDDFCGVLPVDGTLTLKIVTAPDLPNLRM